ncbi:Crp/Fnr family transcriptional regulator [Paraflavitalea sp. CAU 1676]|uniref:Crp/Fnr family transcriptional regulator n=1 Tax=Paraflavitalea sp. CAU 1676 TaxID=3032598 RepID=UPI0023DAAF28|nr:Crp/Fnr family transcriptional regulator [Paraflavitalea sp. CAU 1676]MDF2192685.1 Crp/Fnr family transcriptional regulator [Paraflavitalea sp. CAU 1676]
MEYAKVLMKRYNVGKQADWQQWLDISTIRRYRKGEEFIREGEISKVCGFVISGAFKNVSLNEHDEEKILGFYLENDFLASCESYSKQIPSPFSITAMAPSVAITTSNDKLVELYYKNQTIGTIGLVLTQQLMQKHEEHLKILSFATPQVRYEYVLENKPELLKNTSVTELAKYLYISREAVSRARKSIRVS